MDRTPLAAPDTLLGQLQRGRGAGARAVGPGDVALVVACVCDDPRWDRQVEARATYYARMFRDFGWPLDAIEACLFSPAGRDAKLAFIVTERLAHSGRSDALTLLRRYTANAVRAATLLELQMVGVPSPGWPGWETSNARRQFASRGGHVRPLPAGELEALARATGRDRIHALRELGRRGEPALLVLADDYLARGENPPGLVSGLRFFPGDAVVRRAREWLDEGPAHRHVAMCILADRARADDADVVLRLLETVSREDDWRSLADFVAAAGRLRLRAALPLVADAWVRSPYSYVRWHALPTLLSIDPEAAAPYVEEGLWDCEEQVRLHAAQAVALGPATTGRLHELATDRIEKMTVRAAARARVA